MTKNKLSTQLKKSGQRFAYRTACYFNGQEKYNLTAEPVAEKINSAGQKAKPWLLILARACYQEQVKSYPIKSIRELKQLLELQRPSSALNRYFIGPYEHNQRLVHEVVIDAAHLSTVEQARFLLPETLLLAKFAPLGLTRIELGPQPTSPKLWFHRGPLQTAAVMQGGLLSNERAARVALGVHNAEPINTWSFAEYLTLLSEYWWQLPVQWWPTARNSGRSQNGKVALPWATMLSAAVVMLIVYGSMSSAYLHLTNQWRSNKMQQMSSHVMEQLISREQLETDAEKLHLLAAASALNPEQLLGWNLVAFLKSNSITINQVSGNLNTIELAGEADSVTDLVARLNKLPGISQIEFVAPVRRSRNGEVFRLRIELVAN